MEPKGTAKPGKRMGQIQTNALLVVESMVPDEGVLTGHHLKYPGPAGIALFCHFHTQPSQ